MNLATPPLVPTAPNLPPSAPAPGATPASSPATKPSPAGSAKQPDAASIIAMPLADAIAAATGHLDQVQGMTVGGGTKEGTAAAKVAATLLSDTSMLVQLVHRNAVPAGISPELELNLMTTATSMASASTQVALLGMTSKEKIALKDALGTPAKQASDVLALVADHVARASEQTANPSVAGYL